MTDALAKIATGVHDVKELVMRLEELFYQVDGPPCAYFEIPSASLDRDEAPVRITYKTVAFCARLGDPITTEALLCTVFWDQIRFEVLQKSSALVRAGWALGGHTGLLLFWRLRPAITVLEPELGVDAQNRTEEMCQDQGEKFIPALGPKIMRLRARLDIPGLDLAECREGLGTVEALHIVPEPSTA